MFAGLVPPRERSRGVAVEITKTLSLQPVCEDPHQQAAGQILRRKSASQITPADPEIVEG